MLWSEKYIIMPSHEVVSAWTKLVIRLLRMHVKEICNLMNCFQSQTNSIAQMLWSEKYIITPSHGFFLAANKLAIHLIWIGKHMTFKFNDCMHVKEICDLMNCFHPQTKSIAQMLWSEKYIITPSHEFTSAANKVAIHLIRLGKHMTFKFNDCMHVKEMCNLLKCFQP